MRALGGYRRGAIHVLGRLGHIAREAGDDTKSTQYAMIRQRAATARALLDVSTTGSTASR